ncbi:MAG: CDP-diacylglycerol--glycerol-3-phosphate 3-phosphatidyltransferase [Eubacterium sp.]|nr:CDP-diacylglycerol--glycerol-3-phosphate 3-phosphatidyltransferase [Eubacterium sp.]
MNVANRLTILRVVMIPVFVFFMLWETPFSDYLAAAVFILACITDFFDGYLARKYNQVTTFGKFMDPLADKVLVCSAMICFVADPDCAMPVWVVLAIIAREFIISGFRLVAAEKGVVIAASFWAKIKTTVQMIMAIVLIFNFQHPVFYFINRILIYAALILTIVSLVDYIYKNRDVMSDIDQEVE